MQLNLVAHFEKTGIGKMSFCKEQKNRLLSQPTFWQGQKDSFSSLDARRSGRLYRAKGHGIHCRPILVLLQEANKKIGCFRNRPFGRGRRTLSPRSTLVGQDGSTVPKGTVFTAVLFSSFCKKRKKNRLLLQPTFWQGQKDSNPQQRFWRPTCYHYTIPLSTCSVYHESRFLSTGFLQDLARNCVKG